MATKSYGMQLDSTLKSRHLIDASYIQGSYLVVKNVAERDTMPVVVTNDAGEIVTDGIIVKGSLCYCQAEDILYMYTDVNGGLGWVAKELGASGEDIGEALDTLHATASAIIGE